MPQLIIWWGNVLTSGRSVDNPRSDTYWVNFGNVSLDFDKVPEPLSLLSVCDKAYYTSGAFLQTHAYLFYRSYITSDSMSSIQQIVPKVLLLPDAGKQQQARSSARGRWTHYSQCHSAHASE